MIIIKKYSPKSIKSFRQKYNNLYAVEKGGDVLPIEIKSGKDYARHAALDNVMGNPDYAIPEAFVFQNDNVSVDGNIVYLPVYMLMFLQREQTMEPMIYRVNLDGLQ